MPVPKPNERRQDFMNRCIPIVMSETDDPKQAVAMCSSMYEQARKRLYKKLIHHILGKKTKK